MVNGVQSKSNGSAVATALCNPSLGATRLGLGDQVALFEPATPAINLYLIETGQVRTYQIGSDDSTRLTDIMGPGDWFGVAALAGAPCYGTRAVAACPSVVWTLPAQRVLELLPGQSEIAVEMVGHLARRLEAAHDAAARLVFDDCNQRLIQTLLRFSRTAAAAMQEDGGVVLRITHQQLAQAVGAARETVSLALTQLRQQNLLRTGRNRLLFRPEALERHCRQSSKSLEPMSVS